MKRIGLLLALLLSLPVLGQKVTRFSSIDFFSEEFIQLIELDKEQKTLFQDSLLPAIQFAVDTDSEEHWLALSNHLIRKRISDPSHWEELFRLISFVSENEEYLTLGSLIQHLNGYAKGNPISKVKVYIHQLYLNEVKHYFAENSGLVWKAPYSLWSLNFEDSQPVFTIDEGDIIGIYKSDSTIIMTTSARFFPEQAVLKAQGGTVFWGRVGMPEDELYAELNAWELDVNQGYFRADTAILFAPELYSAPIVGFFEQRLSARAAKNAQYPSLPSYNNNFLLPNV